MANRFWRGGSGTWDTTTTTNWSTTSGGSGGASVPTAADSVFFDQAGTYTVTMTGALRCLNITVSSGTVTFATGTSPTLAISGSMAISAVSTVWSSTGAITFNAAGSTQTIQTSGVTISAPITLNGVSSTFQLIDNLTIPSTATFTLTFGTLDVGTNSATLTCGLFSSSNGNTRRLSFGSSGKIVTNGTGTVWDTSLYTGLTVSGTTKVYISNSTATATTVSPGTQTEANSISYFFNAGSYSLALSAASVLAYDFTGFSGTVSNTAQTIFASLTLSSTATYTAGANTWTFAGTSPSSTITSSGKTLSCPVTFNNTGGGTSGWVLQDAMTVAATQTVTLSAGYINLNGKTLTTGFFNASGTTARGIQFGSGNITLNGAGGTLWTTATSTNFSTTGTQTVNVSYSGATATTITMGAVSGANSISFNFTTGTYALTMSSGNWRSLNFTGFSGTVSNVAQGLYGSMTLSSTATFTAGANAWTFLATSGPLTLNTNGKTVDWPITISASASVSYALQGAFTLGSTRTLTHNSGTVDLNGKTLSAGASYTTGSGTKNLAFNGGTLVCPSGGSTAFNNVNPTGFTTTAGIGTGTISMTAAVAKTFVGGGSTYNCTLNQGGAGALTITGANTFTNITNTAQPATVTFPASTTNTFTSFSLSGTAGNLITINSSTSGTQATVSQAAGTVTVNYLSIKDSAATGGATWNAGANSTNAGNNTGWIFATPTVGNFFSFLTN